MLDLSTDTIVSVIAGATGSFFIWILADTRSKAKLVFIEEQMGIDRQKQDVFMSMVAEKSNHLEIKLAQSEQDRMEIHRSLDRLDAIKASKEVVDGIRSDINSFKAEMDKRFDKLERILEKKN